MINCFEQFLTEHKIWLDFITAVGAITFGIWQIKINLRLKKLQDFVAVAAVPAPSGDVIAFHNTGKINLYLWGYKFPNRELIFDRPRLLTQGTGNNSYYWIPPQFSSEIKLDTDFDFQIFLEDEFAEKWIAEFGGRWSRLPMADNKEKGQAMSLTVWSYRTKKQRWFSQKKN